MTESERLTGWALIVVGLAIALARVLGVTHPAYQAAAHFFMGGIIVGRVLVKKYEGKQRASYLFWLAVFLGAVEVTMFTIGYLKKNPF